ncbi:unnamed protein product [Mytilus edulis]|uniref:Uncharacterized protein n=1 Tax=Mytilus edulis TaxID=6550 RepID=A0A8S3QMQ7_MYTED|nr:unnamed protein product [Mytilus edulis]
MEGANRWRKPPASIENLAIAKSTKWVKSQRVDIFTGIYDLALVPEIASPRDQKYTGIRSRGNWYVDENNIKKKTPSLKKKEGKRKDLTTDDEEAQGPSNLNDHKKTIRRRISHEWIEEDNNSKWYSGTVTGVLTETDGADGAEYEVLYDGDDEPHIIDHLLEDYRSCSLKFIDL